MPTNVLTPAGRRILDAASDLFYREGIHTVGVEAIASAAGVTKKTLYDRFGSKDELVSAYLRERDTRWRGWLADQVSARASAPRDRLLAAFDALGEWMRLYSPRGCAFVNALTELPDPEHSGRAIIDDQKRWLLEYLEGLAADAGIADPNVLAERLLLLLEGAMVTHASGVVADPTGRAKEVAASLLASA